MPGCVTPTKFIETLSMSGKCSTIAETGRYSWQGGITRE